MSVCLWRAAAASVVENGTREPHRHADTATANTHTHTLLLRKYTTPSQTGLTTSTGEVYVFAIGIGQPDAPICQPALKLTPPPSPSRPSTHTTVVYCSNLISLPSLTIIASRRALLTTV